MNGWNDFVFIDGFRDDPTARRSVFLGDATSTIADFDGRIRDSQRWDRRRHLLAAHIHGSSQRRATFQGAVTKLAIATIEASASIGGHGGVALHVVQLIVIALLLALLAAIYKHGRERQAQGTTSRSETDDHRCGEEGILLLVSFRCLTSRRSRHRGCWSSCSHSRGGAGLGRSYSSRWDEWHGGGRCGCWSWSWSWSWNRS